MYNQFCLHSSILTFAVIGTVFNTFAVGFSLYGLSSAGVFSDVVDLSATECLIFSSLISAVDPVAVLGDYESMTHRIVIINLSYCSAIFEEIRVNAGLYFLVMGESLLTDGACVVIYNAMLTLSALPVEIKKFNII